MLCYPTSSYHPKVTVLIPFSFTEQHRCYLLEVGADLFVRPEVGGVVHQLCHSRELRERYIVL